MFGLGSECHKRTYITQLQIHKCMDCLKTKNVNDTFEYEFDEVSHCITFYRFAKRFFYGRFNAKYHINFCKSDNGEKFAVSFIQNASTQCLTDKWLDEFFAKKLDAIPHEN